MKNWARYRKFLVAVLAAAGITAQAAYTDGAITNDEWGKIVLAALGAALVYIVRNDLPPRSRRDLADHVPTRLATEQERPRKPPTTEFP